jgi:8-oxo-dGTP diphosphatase/2-hydroxy-dATP diphosphatase
MKKILTLCLIHQHPKILLGQKKRGFGEGRWNGFGGKVQEGESIEDGAKRELREEAGIEVEALEKVGIIDFRSVTHSDLLQVHIFKTEDYSGVPMESDEMKPQWFYVDQIPFREMWPDDVYWMPLLLKGRKFKGKFLFGEKDVILEKNLEIVKDLD